MVGEPASAARTSSGAPVVEFDLAPYERELVSISRGAALGGVCYEYLRHLRRQGRSSGTLRSYLWAFKSFVRDLVDQGVAQPADIQLRHLERWQDGLYGRGLELASQSIAISAVKGMLRWAGARHLVDPMLWAGVEQVRVPASLPRPLRTEVLDQLISYYKPKPAAWRGLAMLRDRALFFFLLTSGARVSEALRIDRELYGERMTVRQKGGSEKVLIGGSVADHAIDDYLRARQDHHPALFVTHDTNRPLRRLAAGRAREVWRRACRELDIPRFTTHQLRHSCATELLDLGVPEIVVAEQLGHRKLDTIRRYAQVREGRRQEAVDALQERIEGVSARPVILRSIDRRRRRRSAG